MLGKELRSKCTKKGLKDKRKTTSSVSALEKDTEPNPSIVKLSMITFQSKSYEI